MPPMPTNVMIQVGLVVRDVVKTAKAYSEIFGMPMPPIIMTDPRSKSDAKYRGKPTEALAKLAFFNLGQMSLELIEPVGSPSTWQEFLDAKGEGVHHIAFNVTDREKVVADLAKAGIGETQRGDYTGGCYTYMDSEKQLAVIIELLAAR